MFASRASTWPRVHFWRTTIAPRRSRPTTWKEFLPMSMPIVATVEFALLDMAVLLVLGCPSSIARWQGRSTAGPFHYVWSGRASQEVFVDLADVGSCINVSGLWLERM